MITTESFFQFWLDRYSVPTVCLAGPGFLTGGGRLSGPYATSNASFSKANEPIRMELGAK